MVDGSTATAGASARDEREAPATAAPVNPGVVASPGGLASSVSTTGAAKLPNKPQVVRIEVLGDEKVGKTSLICSLMSRHFSERVPAVLLNVQIPAEENNENVIISITDTSSRVSDIVRVANATKRSDAILLVYDLTRPETIQRLRRWLDLIARHKEVPVVLVGNKDDIKTVVATASMDGLHSNQIRQLTSTYQFAVDGGDCSARNFAQVARAFYYAQKSVLYPVEPLYNGKRRQLEPKCIRAIKRTFRLYDHDRDGLLSREELNNYQSDCFGMRLLTTEMDTMIEFLQSTIPEGVKEDGSGIRLEGFIYLWQLFIDRKRPESCWQVLRSLGYNYGLHLEIPPERISLPPHEDDQSAQLTPQAIDFLDALLRQFDGDKDGNLTKDEIDDIFSICEDGEAPWLKCSAISPPVQFQSTTVADKTVLSRSSWVALWSYVAQENPEKLLETFFYLGFDDKTHQAIEFTKGRSTTRQASRVDRNVVTCHVFSASAALKMRFSNALVGKKSVTNAPSEMYDFGEEIVHAVNAVRLKDTSSILLLTEELADGEIEKRADVICFLFDPLNSDSLEFVEKVETHVPSLIPRVFIGLKPEHVQPGSPEWEAVRQVKPGAHLVEDATSMTSAFERLVRTATRPPNAYSSSRSTGGLFSTGALLTIATSVGVMFLGSTAMFRADPEWFAKGVAVLKATTARTIP